MIRTERNAVIHSHGIYLPERVIPNSYFDELLGTNVSDWLEEYVEIYERRWCAENESTADLCAGAAKVALKRGGLSPEMIDLLIVTTDTPEYISPSTASKVQYMTGMVNAAIFDINTACAGFVTSLDVASKYLQVDNNYKYIMVIGVYAMSKYLNMKDKKSVNLFADGAGAMILTAEENSNRGFLASTMTTKGEYSGYMGIYAGGTAKPVTKEVLESGDNLLQLREKFPPELNPTMWSGLARKLCSMAGLTPEDIKRYFLTQINVRSIRETMDMLQIPRDRAQESMHYYGYTGSACIPLAFYDAWEAGLVKKGDIILMIGSGGGLAFAGAAFRL